MFSIENVNVYVSAIGGCPDHRWSPLSSYPWKALMGAMDVSRLARMCVG